MDANPRINAMKKQHLMPQSNQPHQFANATMIANAHGVGSLLLTKQAGSALNLGNRIWFSFMWFFVGMVSTYDAYLGVRYWESMPNMERNPVCLYLIELANGDATIFLGCKAAGTVLVLTAMALFYLRNPRFAQRIAWGVFSFQFGLLLYLTLATS